MTRRTNCPQLAADLTADIFLAALKNGRAKAVRFTTLAALCEVLDCQPGDLLRWEAESLSDEATPAGRLL
ncbi:helix-turn-helix domain-containing protein [Streptomyces coelicoflavus]